MGKRLYKACDREGQHQGDYGARNLSTWYEVWSDKLSFSSGRSKMSIFLKNSSLSDLKNAHRISRLTYFSKKARIFFKKHLTMPIYDDIIPA